jgi:hypothetical protein
MTEVFGLPWDAAMYIFAFSVAYYLGILSPLLIAAFVAVRNRTAMNRRFLFVGTITIATYGLSFLLAAAVVVPVSAFAIYLVPPMKARGYFNGSILLWILDFFVKYWWAILPATICLVAIVATRYFAKRWNRIVEAL